MENTSLQKENQRTWLQEKNPFNHVNNLTDDVMYNATYKRVMGLGLLATLCGIIGMIVISQSGCVALNFISLFHLIPIFMPVWNRAATPFYWAAIPFASILLSVITLFISLVQDCAVEATIVLVITLIIELFILGHLKSMDPTLVEQYRYQLASCGFLGKKAQMETMVSNDPTYIANDISREQPSQHLNVSHRIQDDNRVVSFTGQSESPPPNVTFSLGDSQLSTKGNLIIDNSTG